MKWSALFVGAIALCAASASAGLIDPDLDAVLRDAENDEFVSALIYMIDQVDLDEINARMDAERADRQRRHEFVVRSLQDLAGATQPDILADIARAGRGRVKHFQAFWVWNIIHVQAVPAEIHRLAERADVARVYLDYPIELIEPVNSRPAMGPPSPLTPENGIEAVRAPEVWAMGYTGEGVLVCTLDTGVDGSHPALADRWRGVADPRYEGHPEWALFDPVTGWTFPQDSGSHGTHTMGTTCGGAPGDEIGVAPGAQWIHCAVIDRGGLDQTVTNALLSFQWLIDPDGDPSTSWDVPNVCGNSWGLTDWHGYPDCDEYFWAALDACEAAGTVIVFAAGNEGTSGLRRPADRATDDYRTFAVAAVDAHDPSWPIADFSSLGPTYCTPDGTAAVKPDIAAPGVDVRSSTPGGGYGEMDGTSMATPHVTGVVALIQQANPGLAPEQIKEIIYSTAYDLGSAGEDNTYGWGMIDAFEAVNKALETVALTFTFPDGRPEFIDPTGGQTIRVEVAGQAVPPEPGTGMLYYAVDGGDYTVVAMDEIEPNIYDAVFPAFDCGADVSYYFSAEAETGEIAYNPFTAPDSTYFGEAYSGIEEALYDDFETDSGYTVEDIDLEDGSWERGVPAGGDYQPGDRGDPPTDYDGSGQCWVTDNAPGNSDVDGGPTQLTSSPLDATGLQDPYISYARWFTNDDQDDDRLDVEISGDDGYTWKLLESVPHSAGWNVVSFRIADYVTPTDQIRLRFSATDNPNDSVTEAAIDALRIYSYYCEESAVPGDVNGDGVVDVVDLLAVLAAWGPCPGCPEDLNDDDVVDVLDLLIVLGEWT